MKNENKLDVWKCDASNGEILEFDLSRKNAVYIINKKRLSNEAIMNMLDLNLDVSFQNGYCYLFSHDFNKQKFLNKLEIVVNEYLTYKEIEELTVQFCDLYDFGVIRVDYWDKENNYGMMHWRYGRKH